jgi:signal transduction histidine kinase/ActR/RegA family two-component response regulator/HAMP domain-containing protein
MTRRLDLSVGERIALGFGAAAVLLGVLVVMSQVWTRDIAAERHLHLSVIAPRAEAADRLETAVLYVGIAARDRALAPGPEHRRKFEAAARRMRDELQTLSRLPQDPDSLGLFAKLPGLVAAYERAARAAVAASPARAAELEDAMSLARRELLGVVAEYVAAQRRKVDETRAKIAVAVDRMGRAALGLGAVVLGLLALTGLATVRAVHGPALALVGAARRLARGDFEPAVAMARDESPRRDEIAELSASFGRMALELRAREDRLRADARLASAMAASLDVARLSESALEVIAEHLGVDAAAVYLSEEGRLRLRSARGRAADELAPGEGVAGRAVETRRTVASPDLAESPFPDLRREGTPTGSVAAVPLVLQDQRVAGAIAVAARAIAPDAIAFLEHASNELAVSLQNALAHEQIARLAAELRQKNDELQSRYEEIQAQQEELQAQHEELQAQSEELQAQHEELQAQGEELQAQAESLRRTVEKLTASEEALRQADKHKSEFLALLSHELRNPLAPIRNSLYVLARARPGSEEAARAQRIIGRQVEQLAGLVEDLLDVTRISRGKVQLRRAVVDLGRLVRQAAEDHRADFSASGIELAVRAPDHAVAVDGDPTRLAQVIGNLLQNAAKFTPARGRVLLGLEVEEGRARLRVRDTGAGMAPETLAGLFQPFMQAEPGLARTKGGLGLGLTLVKGLVEMHGGSVRAASEGPGKGSEFVVELPTTSEPLAEEPPKPPAPRAARRVLVIEDNADAADSLREALQLSGHQVEVAYSGTQGLAKARVWRPAVVLCDVGLPDISGYEVARGFREDPSLQYVFLVALTGYALPDDVRRASEAGFDDHLGKPPSFERLESLLSRVPPVPPASPSAGRES